MSIIIDEEHKFKTTGWLLKIMNDKVLSHYILSKKQVFSLFFSIINRKIEWTDDIKKMIDKIIDDNRSSENKEDQYNFLKKFERFSEDNSVSDIEINDLWLGNLLFDEIKGEKKELFIKSISYLTNRYNDTVQEGKKEEDVKAGNDLSYIIEQKKKDEEIIKPLYSFIKEKEDLKIKKTNYQNNISMFDCHRMFLETFIIITPIEKNILEFSYMIGKSALLNEFYNSLSFDEFLSEITFKALFSIEEDLDLDDSFFSEKCLLLSEMISVSKENWKVKVMSEYWSKFFSTPVRNHEELLFKIIEPVRKKYHSGTIGNILDEDRDIIKQLLLHLNLAGKPTNILLYSGYKVDKYELVRKILNENNLFAFELSPDIPNEELKTACYLAHSFIEYQDPNAILIVSKTEKVLSKSRTSKRLMMFFEITTEEDIEEQKIEVELLKNKKVKTIWLAINPQNIHEDSITRFTYSLEVKPATRADRKEAIEDILNRFNLSDKFKHDLSQHTQLSEQQLINAMVLAEKMNQPVMNNSVLKSLTDKLLNNDNNFNQEENQLYDIMKRNSGRIVYDESQEKIILKAILQSEKALNRKEKESLRSSVTQYDLDYLNVSSGFTIEQILGSLKKKPNSSLCLFGMPGTGKTQFSEYLALSIDKPIIIKNAGEILGKFVGETEKNIISMFEEADETGSILLLDEGDSFLRDRSLARTSWETSMVNQLLQSMERFNGIFILATNLFENLDIAALRRFTFKIEFLAMEPEQRWKMFKQEVGEEFEKLTEEEKVDIKSELDFMFNLTPGDFTVVKRQENILGEKLDAFKWLKQLKFEFETKVKSMDVIKRTNVTRM